jgi:hypothetical protein
MKEAFLAFLMGSGSGVPALVGARATWGLNDQATGEPRIALQLISGAPEYADDGEAGIGESRVQVDCYGPTQAAAVAVARAVKARVSGAAVTQSGVEFQAIYIDSERDDVDVYDGGRRVHEVSIDLIIWHKE